MADKSNKKRADELLRQAYTDNYASIYRFCLSRLKDRHKAEDCVQEAFIVLYNKYLDGEEVEYVTAFLMKTASNYVLKKFRENKKAQAEVDIEEVINLPSQGEDVDERLTFEQYSRQISAALSTLDSELFRLRYIEEYKIDEIAKMVDMSVPAVTTRLSRIRSKLREVFADKFNY